MSNATEKSIERFMKALRTRNPHQQQFHQAVHEVVCSTMPLYLDNRAWRDAAVLERMTEPDRILGFRVTWEADDGCLRVNRAWRVQFSHALGPYKGGLRFSPHVDTDVLKFLGFEQTLKNALTGLPMGGAKGGADVDPKTLSERELMRFCQSLMAELHRHIGPDTDVPAGDIGVGEREISWLFGQYLRLRNVWAGVLTGKHCSFGGSAGRSEATGHGCVYFLRQMLEHAGEGLEDKRIAVSGSGNVSLHAAGKALGQGARVVTLSDSDGFVHAPDGFSDEQLEAARALKLDRRGRIGELAEDDDGLEYHAGKKPWGVDCDVALPCATQNELDEEDAATLLDNGVVAVCEGANMPLTAGAAGRVREREVLYAPGKAANAGGVTVSGLEQSQNATRVSWSRDEVDTRLQEIMRDLHEKCVEHGSNGDRVDYVHGANRASFIKVADATLAYGAV